MSQQDVKRRILGVDPGTNILGYAVLDIDGERLNLVQMGVLSLQNFKDHQTKLKEIYLQLQDIIECFLPREMAIESPFYGKNVQSMLKLGRAQGVAIAAGITMGLEIVEYSPKKIKQSVTGNGNASKEQVSAMLGHLLGKSVENQKLDATDALAAAMCHHLQRGAFVNAKSYSGWKQFLTENPGRAKT